MGNIHPDLSKQQRSGLVAGVIAAVDDGADEPGDGIEVDLEGSGAGRDGPDVAEGDAGEVTAPAEGQRNGAHVGQDGVADVVPQAVALKGIGPDAVGAKGTRRLTYDVLEQRLSSEREGDVEKLNQPSKQSHADLHVCRPRHKISYLPIGHLNIAYKY